MTEKRRATFALILAILCFGTIPLFLRYFTPYIDAWTANGYRYLVAVMLYMPFLFRKVRARKIDRRLWKLALIPATFSLTLQSTWAWAPYYIEPGLMSFLGRSTLIWTITGSFILFHDERPLVKSIRFWAGLFIAVAGFTGLSLGGETVPRGGTLTGIFLVLVSSVFSSSYMLSVRYFFRKTDSRIAFSVIALYTSAGTTILMLILGKPTAFLGLPLKINLMIALSAMIGIGIAHVLFYTAQKYLGSAISSSAVLFSAFYTAFLSYLIFDERLTMFQWSAGLLIAAGGILLVTAQNKVGIQEPPGGKR